MLQKFQESRLTFYKEINRWRLRSGLALKQVARKYKRLELCFHLCGLALQDDIQSRNCIHNVLAFV